MKIVIDYDKCIGIGSCEAIAPHLFEVSDEGQVKILDEHPDESERAALDEAVTACPTGAISVE